MVFACLNMKLVRYKLVHFMLYIFQFWFYLKEFELKIIYNNYHLTKSIDDSYFDEFN